MSTAAPFAGLSCHGNYCTYHPDERQIRPLPRGMTRLPLDGTIRLIRKLGIPVVDVVAVENGYGNHWFARRVGYAIRNRDLKRLHRHQQKQEDARERKQPRPHPDLLLCIREASRAAHRERDAAQEAYQRGRHRLAGNARRRKEQWYCLKDRGIVAAHTKGLLHYVGTSPQGMAVYEYGDGGMACFHSTLHPAGSERKPVPNHPETLLVEAKDKVRGVSQRRVEITLDSLPSDLNGYERSAQPRIERAPRVCYACGEEGHVARNCPERWGEFSGEYAYA